MPRMSTFNPNRVEFALVVAEIAVPPAWPCAGIHFRNPARLPCAPRAFARRRSASRRGPSSFRQRATAVEGPFRGCVRPALDRVGFDPHVACRDAERAGGPIQFDRAACQVEIIGKQRPAGQCQPAAVSTLAASSQSDFRPASGESVENCRRSRSRMIRPTVRLLDHPFGSWRVQLSPRLARRPASRASPPAKRSKLNRLPSSSSGMRLEAFGRPYRRSLLQIDLRDRLYDMACGTGLRARTSGQRSSAIRRAPARGGGRDPAGCGATRK